MTGLVVLAVAMLFGLTLLGIRACMKVQEARARRRESRRSRTDLEICEQIYRRS